ncbi:hypothetical protein [Shewanella sp. GXUN23E]|uniref:hypothetical protein n=1 Tax=Shewanella sp. GXUN23E TaxID=3422498 RepID=UPI003D7EBAD7
MTSEHGKPLIIVMLLLGIMGLMAIWDLLQGLLWEPRAVNINSNLLFLPAVWGLWQYNNRWRLFSICWLLVSLILFAMLLWFGQWDWRSYTALKTAVSIAIFIIGLAVLLHPATIRQFKYKQLATEFEQ